MILLFLECTFAGGLKLLTLHLVGGVVAGVFKHSPLIKFENPTNDSIEHPSVMAHDQHATSK